MEMRVKLDKINALAPTVVALKAKVQLFGSEIVQDYSRKEKNVRFFSGCDPKQQQQQLYQE